jgi:hypothetical protein
MVKHGIFAEAGIAFYKEKASRLNNNHGDSTETFDYSRETQELVRQRQEIQQKMEKIQQLFEGLDEDPAPGKGGQK